MIEDINKNKVVFMELYQLKMRQWDIKNSYDLCKSFQRGEKDFSQERFIEFLHNKRSGCLKEKVRTRDYFTTK